MMKLPVVSGREVVKALERAGFWFVGQRGSHAKLRKAVEGKTRTVIVPMHDALKKGTLHRILKDAGLSLEEFEGLR